MLRQRAPAKINLFLHVLGRRADGFHTLQSLVAFSEFGDELEIEPAHALSLSVSGPVIGGWSLPWETRDNSVLQAALRLMDHCGLKKAGARIHLIKNIPIAAGLGGGTTDAAAALLALNKLWDAGLAESDLETIGLKIGADVPVCLHGRPTFVGGIGERLAEVPALPQLSLVIAHTKHLLPTMDVFEESRARDWSEATATLPEKFPDLHALVRFLKSVRNDLEAPAIRLQEHVAALLSDMNAAHGCLLARMSGSGAACFGIFQTDDAAAAAARQLEAKGWWAVATRLASQ